MTFSNDIMSFWLKVPSSYFVGRVFLPLRLNGKKIWFMSIPKQHVSWRHKFFCKEKHSMFDFLAQCDEEEMETNGVKKEAPGVLSEASLDQIDSQQPDAKEVTQTCQTSPDPPPDKKAKMSKKESKRHLGSKTDTPNTQQGRRKSFESKPKEKGDVKGQTRFAQ